MRPRRSRSSGQSMATNPAGNAASSPNVRGSIAVPEQRAEQRAEVPEHVDADTR